MFLKASTLAIALLSSVSAFASNEKLIPSPVEKIFTPLGFDDNDNVEVVVQGVFRNSCYKTGPVDVSVDTEKNVIKVYPQSYEYKNVVCALMMVPFTQTVKIGMLPVGKYQVIVANSDEVASQELSIRPRLTETPDDFLYAPVEQAHIDFGATPNEHAVEIRGRYPMTLLGCAIVTEVRVSQTPGNVLLVLPIMQLLTSEAECKARGWTPKFNIKQAIPVSLADGDYLLHVRVLNGNAFNKLERVIQGNN